MNHKEKFLAFHEENPHVYQQLCGLAWSAHYAGLRRIGIKRLFEVLRWEHSLKTTGDEFKLNNNYTSFYARLIEDENPELAGIFEKRKVVYA